VLQSDLRTCSLNGLVGLFAIPVVLLLISLVVLGFLLQMYFLSLLHSLPKEISWSFMNQLTHLWNWKHHGDRSGYYSRVYERSSKEYRNVEILLSTMFKNQSIEPGIITAIYNHELTVSFVNHWKLTITRKIQNSDFFFACTYSKDEAKKEIKQHFDQEILNVTTYNVDLIVPLIPVIHGTGYYIAGMISYAFVLFFSLFLFCSFF
jgi:hypothetical protein